MQIILVHPEIPHNTGCAARLAAATGVRLHLVEPLGFSLEDRYLKRAGLDYWPMVDLVVHADWATAAEAVTEGVERPLSERLRLFTARGGRSLFETDFCAEDLLVFGSESSGLPDGLLEAHRDRRVYVPIRAGVRSLNLANTVCLGLYTALDRAGLPLPDNDGRYVAHPDGDEEVHPSQGVRRLAPAPGARGRLRTS
jgi:tRNA (cytidine/uridine-2'-O-)-methyltransferase